MNLKQTNSCMAHSSYAVIDLLQVASSLLLSLIGALKSANNTTWQCRAMRPCVYMVKNTNIGLIYPRFLNESLQLQYMHSQTICTIFQAYKQHDQTATSHTHTHTTPINGRQANYDRQSYFILNIGLKILELGNDNYKAKNLITTRSWTTNKTVATTKTAPTIWCSRFLFFS